MTPDRIRCASGARIEAAIPQKTRQRQTNPDQDTAEKPSTTSPTTAPEGSNTAVQEGMCDITPFPLSHCHVSSYHLNRLKGGISAVGRNRPFSIF